MDDLLRQELAHLSNVPLLLEARIPCVKLTVEEILGLEAGTVLRTCRAAGESVDVSVSGQPISQGELIVIDNMLAARLSDFGEKNYG
ncbi:MAG: FliM/FliN family flagellar motor switch protein [Bryobacteraceae bacterium]|nr:FliM/FliN family flagellar motor switch protein [Bryobacteraceae bacterium]